MTGRWIFLAWLLAALPATADVHYSMPPSADAFARADDPTLNYGAAGVVCAAGAESRNGNGDPRGRCDALMMFDTVLMVNELNAMLGDGQWRVTAILLRLRESGAPMNPLFPRGAGRASLAWISNDDWSEGGGTPNAPQTGFGNQLTWEWLTLLMANSQRTPLAEFDTLGADGWVDLPLPLAPDVVSDLTQPGTVTFHIAPVTSMLGFSFHSRTFGDGDLRPQLTITAQLIADTNCDDVVDESDVAALALGLLDPPAYLAQYPQCNLGRVDLNGDGAADGDDLSAWMSLQ